MAADFDEHLLDGRRVLVLATEQVGERMAGPAIRSLNLARELSRRCASVTLATPSLATAGDPMFDGLALAAFGTPSARSIGRLARDHDVVVTQPQRVDVAWSLHRSAARTVYDLYVPSFVERIAQLGIEPGDQRLKAALLERDRREYAAALQLGDSFICATARQRDHWMGALGALGRLDLGLLERDASGTRLVGVVPFGLPDSAPPALDDSNPGAIRGSLVPEDSVVLLWTGGLWNWFDPVTIVEALASARETNSDLRMVVMGMHHPEAAWEEQEASRVMRRRADELGLLADGSLVLCDSWVPYEQRHRYLLDADVAVSAHRDTLETRLSFRTRFLDHLWAGVPTVTTEGDELSGQMAAHGAALMVAEGDVDGWRDAMLQLAGHAELRASMRAAAVEFGDRYRWSSVVAPLAAAVADTATAAPRRSRRAGLLAYVLLLVRIRVKAKGLRSLVPAVQGAITGAR